MACDQKCVEFLTYMGEYRSAYTKQCDQLLQLLDTIRIHLEYNPDHDKEKHELMKLQVDSYIKKLLKDSQAFTKSLESNKEMFDSLK